MALDACYLSHLKDELSAALIGARIDRIASPTRDEVVLSMRGLSGSCKLYISCSAESARAALTDAQIENPKVPTLFCTLLRKHLLGGRLLGIAQARGERVLRFRFSCATDIGDIVENELVLEAMGRNSNLMLLGPDGRVIDAVRRIGPDRSRVRAVLPGAEYADPPANQHPFFLDIPPDDLFDTVRRSPAREIARAVLDCASGLGPDAAREIAARSFHGAERAPSELNEPDRPRFAAAFEAICAAARQPAGWVIARDAGARPIALSYFSFTQYGAAVTEEVFPSPSAAAERFFAARDELRRRTARGHDLARVINQLVERVGNRLANQRADLEQSLQREDFKRRADLLSANLYRIEPGMSSIEVEDFYAGGEKISLRLDPRKSPQQNITALYSQYKKAHSAEQRLREQIARGEEELQYLQSVQSLLPFAASDLEFGEIRQELGQNGFLRALPVKKNQKQAAASQPMRFVSSDGFIVAVGKNNRQNDQLSLKTARPTDIWLHTQKAPGSHVVVFAEGRAVPDRTLDEAAQLAAHYSSARQSAGVAVDIAPARALKKPPGSLPGKVIYREYTTVYVTPDPRRVDALERER